MFAERFLTASLRRHPYGLRVANICAAAIQAVEPGRAVADFLRRHPLPAAQRVFVLGLGKASLPMTRAALQVLQPQAALAITKHGTSLGPYPAVVLQGGHPVPDSRSLQAGQAVLNFVSGLGADDLLLCLISGGASALVTAPRPGLTLDDLQALTRQLLACGARVDEINTLRRHLDGVKGGGLARAAFPARVLSLILSDVVGNPLEVIASGPTAPDPSTRADALGVLQKYALSDQVPDSVLAALERTPETPKPGERCFERVENVLIGSNALAAQAALAQARAQGFQTQFLGDNWQGEARLVAQELCARLKASSLPRPFCLVAGGETTVTLAGRGLGGRNQELALAAALELAGEDNLLLVTLATDGEDGPTDAAGAVVTGESALAGLDARVFLAENDSYHFFAALGDLLQPGPTGTNVNDLTFLFGF
jgi:hydroxypyruvate reductase